MLTLREAQIYNELITDAIEPTAGDKAQAIVIAEMKAQCEHYKEVLQEEGSTYETKNSQGDTVTKKHSLAETLQRTQTTLATQLDKWNKGQLAKEKAYFEMMYKMEKGSDSTGND